MSGRVDAANVPQTIEFHTPADKWSGGAIPSATQAHVVDPLPDLVLYGPRGEVVSRVSRRNPIGFVRR